MINITNYGALNYMILTSESNRIKLEQMFEKYIKLGYDPNQIQDIIYSETKCSPNDLLNEDIQILKSKVESMVRYYGS